MHRLPLIAAILSLVAAPAIAQPPWPAAAPQPEISPRHVSPTAETPRRITPPQASGRTGETLQPSRTARGTPSPWTAFASLALIVCVILAAARVWKKHGPPIGGVLPVDALEILGQRALDRRNAIQIVRCGSRILILGVGEDGLRTLAEITDSAEVEHLTRTCRLGESDRESGPGLLGILRRSPAAAPADEPLYHGRIDEVLAQRFPPPPPATGTMGEPVHA